MITRASRRSGLALLGAVGVAATLVLSACSGGGRAAAHVRAKTPATTAAVSSAASTSPRSTGAGSGSAGVAADTSSLDSKLSQVDAQLNRLDGELGAASSAPQEGDPTQ